MIRAKMYLTLIAAGIGGFGLAHTISAIVHALTGSKWSDDLSIGLLEMGIACFVAWFAVLVHYHYRRQGAQATSRE